LLFPDIVRVEVDFQILDFKLSWCVVHPIGPADKCRDFGHKFVDLGHLDKTIIGPFLQGMDPLFHTSAFGNQDKACFHDIFSDGPRNLLNPSDGEIPIHYHGIRFIRFQKLENVLGIVGSGDIEIRPSEGFFDLVPDF
jgi:hypothetical protein